MATPAQARKKLAASDPVLAELIERIGPLDVSERERRRKTVRPDVVSGGDLGIRKAIQLAYDLEEMPKPTEVVERAEAWRPHRSLAMLYLWESLAVTPVQE